jgi:hypothetical protein
MFRLFYYYFFYINKSEFLYMNHRQTKRIREAAHMSQIIKFVDCLKNFFGLSTLQIFDDKFTIFAEL